MLSHSHELQNVSVILPPIDSGQENNSNSQWVKCVSPLFKNLPPPPPPNGSPSVWICRLVIHLVTLQKAEMWLGEQWGSSEFMVSKPLRIFADFWIGSSATGAIQSIDYRSQPAFKTLQQLSSCAIGKIYMWQYFFASGLGQDTNTSVGTVVGWSVLYKNVGMP